jgi:hypothetical protein
MSRSRAIASTHCRGQQLDGPAYWSVTLALRLKRHVARDRGDRRRHRPVRRGTFPDYELPDHTSVSRRLSELQGDDPLILTLAR